VGVILIATDGSRAATAAEGVGFELARARGDTALLVCVWAPLKGSFGLPVPEFLDSDFVDAERDWAEETLAAATGRAAADGVEAETVIAKGRPVDELCRTARERSAGLIVIGSEGWGTVISLLLGRTTLGVLEHAPCPVLVVRDPGELAKKD
jgi:nucleotide-binding universal stress UspA family protein